MDSERWKRIERVFCAVLETDEAERAALIDELCGRDPELRAEVEAMLAAHAEGEELEIESWLQDRGGEPDPDEDSRDGAQVGPYHLVRILGEGGMGVVWLAEQASPMRRQVALKIIRLGMDTDQVVARFESERQALALMTHPNIAQVFDAGATSEGRPYFAMEFVEGQDIHRHCDTQGLTIRQRIELFLRVCDGTRHAHLKGIIHRDLKPSNVLVATGDRVGTPKIIDFGIAKATDEALFERTPVTRTEHLLGTPAYMSPEQASTVDRDVDTRSDVYSLGVMLYELLVGALPAEPQRLADHALRRSQEEIRVPRPSARLANLGDSGPRIAADRGTTFESLIRILEGDLDWIVLKAMARERDRRYSSVEALARDLGRYLSHESVEARPPSVFYECRKFVRRHRVAVTAAAAIGIAIAAGAGLATVSMIRAREAEAAARQDAETARRIKDFMVGIFSENDPYRSARGDVTARELLDRGAEQLERELADEPLLRSDIMSAVGKAYLSLGMFDQADPVLTAALEHREGRPGVHGQDLAEIYEYLGELRHYQARYDESLLFLEKALALREVELGTEHEDLGDALAWLSRTHAATADYERARKMEQRALAIRRAVSDDRAIASSLRQLGVIATYEGRHRDAIALHEEAFALCSDALGMDHPMTLDLRESMALSQQSLGEPEIAEATHRSVLAAREEVFGEMHPTVAFSYHNLGRTLAAMGRHEEAIPLYERSIEIREDAYGSSHPTIAHSLESLAIARATTGDMEAADALFHRAFATYEAALGADHPETIESLLNLAMLAVYQGSRDLAVERIEEMVRRGLDDPAQLRSPPLDQLIGMPRYDALIERAETSGGEAP